MNWRNPYGHLWRDYNREVIGDAATAVAIIAATAVTALFGAWLLIDIVVRAVVTDAI